MVLSSHDLRNFKIRISRKCLVIDRHFQIRELGQSKSYPNQFFIISKYLLDIILSDPIRPTVGFHVTFSKGEVYEQK